ADQLPALQVAPVELVSRAERVRIGRLLTSRRLHEDGGTADLRTGLLVTDELAVHVLDEVAEPKRVHDEVRDIRTSLAGTHTGVDQRVLHVQPRAIHADATKLVRVHRAVDTEERGRARRRLWNPLRDA